MQGDENLLRPQLTPLPSPYLTPHHLGSYSFIFKPIYSHIHSNKTKLSIQKPQNYPRVRPAQFSLSPSFSTTLGLASSGVPNTVRIRISFGLSHSRYLRN